MSDKFSNLFHSQNDLGLEHEQPGWFDNALNVTHKISKVQNKKDQSLRQTNYDDDFKVMGKRLLHIEGINGKKIYIGVKSLREDEIKKPGEIKYPNWYEQHQKLREGENFMPIEDSHGKSKNMISTFEI